MGRSTEDWQSYRLGERIIHTPAVHGARWQALAGEGMTAETAETTAEGDAGAASVSEAMQDAEAEPSIRAKTLMERLIARALHRYLGYLHMVVASVSGARWRSCRTVLRVFDDN